MKNEEFLLKSASGGFLRFYLPFRLRIMGNIEYYSVWRGFISRRIIKSYLLHRRQQATALQ